MKSLVDVAAPLWAGEMEVARTYFHSPRRTSETDAVWLRRQCYKEFWGSGVGDRDGLYLGPVKRLHEVFTHIDRDVDRHEVLSTIEDLHTEFAHYCLLADIHDAISTEKLNPHDLVGWDADIELTSARFEYRLLYGQVGYFASRFTEGGNNSIFVEGAKLGGSPLNDLIASAFRQIIADEAGHTRTGLEGLVKLAPSAVDWETVFEMVRHISVLRVRMRNEQFGFPLTADRVRAIENGDIEPMPFDAS